MRDLRVTLLADGSSDRVLLRPIRWLLLQYLPHSTVSYQWADLFRLRHKPRTLADRMAAAVSYYPCELLFVHRDAEREYWQRRRQEIVEAREQSGIPVPVVPVVPVRMTEAWLLFDEPAVRLAAGNPNGSMDIGLPHGNPESLADPKACLYDALRLASGLSGRRLRAFDVHHAVQRVGDYIGDFSPLRSLNSFSQLERDVASWSSQLPCP